MASKPRVETIVERKRKPDGSVREYLCELVARRPAFVVVRFRLEHGGAAFGPPVEVPPGSISYGWFWQRRPYDLYRMFRADGSPIAHRFDAVADVRLEEGAIDYRDLVLDWWVLPDDTIIEEDRAELDTLVAERLLSPTDADSANRAALEVLSRYRHIIDDVVAMERRLGIEHSSPATD